MANEQPSNFTSNGVVLAVMAVTGAVFFYRDAPLQGLRPEVTEPQFHHAASVQDVEARLWQDPFAAVAKVSGEKRLDAAKGKADSQNHLSPPDVDADTSVVGVMMLGGPYAEDNERRRRTRYAVLSGLEEEGFVPEDNDHIGYWRPGGADEDILLPETIPFEWFRSERSQDKAQNKTLVLWLNEDILRRRPLQGLATLAQKLDAKANTHINIRILGPFSSDTLSLMVREAAEGETPPIFAFWQVSWLNFDEKTFEWTLRCLPKLSANNEARSLLPITIGDKQPRLNEAFHVAAFKMDGRAAPPKRSRDPPPPNSASIISWQKASWRNVLAPESGWERDDLLALSRRQSPDDLSGPRCEPARHKWPSLSRVRFFSYGATVDDQRVLEDCESARCSGSLADYFLKWGVAFRRTIATDCDLAKSIVHELKLRHVEPGASQSDNWGRSHIDHVALISEWDTIYGREFANTMVGTFVEELEKKIPGSNAEQKEQLESSIRKCGNDNVQYDWIHKRKYLRGLEGSIASDDKKKDSKDTSGESEKTADKERAKAKADEKAFDRPHGQGQQDYLRRIAKDLRRENDELLNKNERIAAIGVVGSDVFDKLLVLRALKPEFPEAIFFTTDFDYALLMPSELAWTRNLIIASSFGPKLRDEIQGEIPPFRDNYQTSAFLAARLAIQDFGSETVAQSTINSRLTPRIFEIERGGGILAFPPLEPDEKENPQATPACPKPPFLMTASTSIIDSGRSTSGAPDSSTQPDNKNEICAAKKLAHCGRIHPEVKFPYAKPKGLSWIAGALAVVTVLLAFSRIITPSSAEESPADKSGFSEKWIEFIAFIGLMLLFIGAAILICHSRHTKVLLYIFIMSMLVAISSLEYFINVRRPRIQNINSPIRKTPSVEIVLLGFILVAAILICVEWDQIGLSIREASRGTPLTLLQGVSLWPTILFRILIGILSVCLLVRGWRKLRTNIIKIQIDMDLEEPTRIIACRKTNEYYTIRNLILNFSATRKIKTGQSKISMIAKNRYVIKFIACIYYFISAFLTRSRFRQPDLFRHGQDWKYNVELAWEDLVFQGRLFARICRVAVYAIFMVFVFFVLTEVFGAPNIPGRGDLAVDIYSVVITVNVFLFLALLFFVADATYSFWLFVRELGPVQTEWPDKTKRKYENDLRMAASDPILDYWIDLDFIAKRTKCLGDIIYYPFAILALMIISRSVAFANFAPSPPIVITQALSFVILLSCAFALRRAAEKARDAARNEISRNIIRAKGRPNGARRAAQLEALLARVEGLHEGAFSPITQQPPVRALLLPLGGLGWTTLLDFGLIPGL